MDVQNYISEYSKISLAKAAKEPLYVLIVCTFKKLGMDFNAYRAASSAIVILIIGFSTYKTTKNYNLALGIFLIYPFALYVVQIRNCYAFAFSLIAFAFLSRNFEPRNKRFGINKYDLLYVFFIVCAALIHVPYMAFLLFILAEKFDLKKVIIITGAALVGESIILNKDVLLKIAALFNVRQRLEWALYVQSINGQSDISFRVIVTFVLFLCFFVWLIYRMRSKVVSTGVMDERVYNQNCFALKANILCLIILPIIPLIREVFRLQEALMLFNFITITNNMDQNSSWKKDTLRNMCIIAALLFIVFVDDYLYILRFDQMREYVLHAVFK